MIAARFDFFVSYTRADEAWARWIAWQLEENLHVLGRKVRVFVQAWDLVPGTNWTAVMHEALRRSDRVLPVVSTPYLEESRYGSAEWQAIWPHDPDGARRAVVPVRVGDCEPDGLLRTINLIDLVGLPEPDAAATLLVKIGAAISGRAKPPLPPPFPLSAASDLTATDPGGQGRTSSGPDLTGVSASGPGHRSRAPGPVDVFPGGGGLPASNPAPTATSRTDARARPTDRDLRDAGADADADADAGAGAGASRIGTPHPEPAHIRPPGVSTPLSRVRATDSPRVQPRDDGRSGADTAAADRSGAGPSRRDASGADVTGPRRPVRGPSGPDGSGGGRPRDDRPGARPVADPLSRVAGAAPDSFALPAGVAFAPSGRLLATASIDGSARVWEVRTGRQVALLSDHAGGVTGVAFSPDGSIVATGSADASARLWEVATGHPVAVLSGHVGGLTAVVFSPDGSIVATASVDGSARLWRWASGQPWVTLPGSGGAMVGVTFSPDGAAVATVTRHGHLRLWRRAGWRLAREIALGAGVPRGVAFAPDGALVATVAGTVELWDVASGAPALRLGDDAGASCVAFAPDGRHLAVGCADGAVRLWDTGVRPPRPAGALPPPTPTAADLPPGASCSAGGAPSGRGGLSVRALAFSPDGSLLAAATEEGVTRLWHVFGRRLLATLAGLPRGGWAVLLPDGGYKVAASAGRSFWWELRNVRFGVGNLDPHDTTIRPLPHDLPLPGLVRR